MVVDAHQHFWKFDPVRDTWMDPSSMQAIRRDFLPADLAPILDKLGIDGTIAVQADQSQAETQFLLEQAQSSNIVFGVVGWVDLMANDLEKHLEHYQSESTLVGFRHILQAEPAGYMLQPEFIRGVQLLAKFDFTYDILVYAHQLDDVLKFIPHLEGQRLIIDHLAKPDIKHGEISKWRHQMKEVSGHSNIYCKISGMITEADWSKWKPEDLHPYMDTVFEYFGVDRCVYGSDWPVCTLAGSYQQVFGVIDSYLSQFDQTERDKVLGKNALDFYNIDIPK